MNARALPYALVAIAALALPARAADDKVLQNMKGSVTYQTPKAPAKPLAPSASIALEDKDYTITGAASLAGVTLPDSSRVLVGSDSKVQLGFFNAAMDDNKAKFIVYNGKVRFVVQHPAGAKADYTFQTATGSIAVRGTEGDIETAGNDLRVNVYELCEGSPPVQVTTKDGKTFSLVAGQSLLAELVNGVLRAQVQSLTQQMIDQFSGDFGVPTSWDAAKGQVIGYAQGQANSAIDSATGGYGSQITGAIGGLFGKRKSEPTPTPSPKSDTCTHP